MRVQWITSGTRVELSQENSLTGGNIYENYLRNILKKNHKLEIIYLNRGNHKLRIIRSLQFGKYLLKNRSLKFSGDIVIRDVFSTVFAPFKKLVKNIIILHHLDISGVKYKGLYKIIEKRFFDRINLADKVVVVSEYWKNILERKGCSNVSVIYNSFDLEMFKFDQNGLSEFQNRLGINKGKPIIYLGNSTSGKGYIESYEVLRDIDAVFVVTGRNKINIPVLQYYLSYPDYLKLLKISILTITMSKFNEGWCRVAHESMLCETPVVGSGKGGMRELLEKGSQIICEDFCRLKPIVVDIINNRKKLDSMSSKGKKFASQYSLDYFKESWIKLISS